MKQILPALICLALLSSCTHPERRHRPLQGFEVDRLQVVDQWSVQDGHGHDHGIGPTHGGVIVDGQGDVYVSSDHGVFVFSTDGHLLRSFKSEPFQHLHAMTSALDGEKEVFFGAGYKRAEIVKFDRDGRLLQRIEFPEESGVKGNYVPTAVAVTPNGEILVADGYGSNVIFSFDKTGKYLSHFGGKDKDDVTKFTTPHGIAVDHRYTPPRILISDREKRRLVHFDLEGNFIGEVVTGLRRPCAVSILDGHVAIAELEGRVAILNPKNELIGTLGDNPNKKEWAQYGVERSAWHEGVHTAPHGLSWDQAGSLYVQDWNKHGRLTKYELRFDE